MLNFHRPNSLAQAQELYQESENPAYIAGGQSLIAGIRLGLAEFSDLIDLSGIAGLKSIDHSASELTIGALCTHAEISNSPLILQHLPALAKLAGEIGDIHIRNRGTLGGSLAHSDPAADYAAAVLGLGATISTTHRKIKAEDFCQGTFANALAAGEIITGVQLPIPLAASYQRFSQPASRFALVGVWASLFPGRNVYLGVTGVFSHPRKQAYPLPEFNLEEINSDLHASAEYRVHLLKVLTQRAVDELGNSA